MSMEELKDIKLVAMMCEVARQCLQDEIGPAFSESYELGMCPALRQIFAGMHKAKVDGTSANAVKQENNKQELLSELYLPSEGYYPLNSKALTGVLPTDENVFKKTLKNLEDLANEDLQRLASLEAREEQAGKKIETKSSLRSPSSAAIPPVDFPSKMREVAKLWLG